jgi:hypothetical protein
MLVAVEVERHIPEQLQARGVRAAAVMRALLVLGQAVAVRPTLVAAAVEKMILMLRLFTVVTADQV